MLSRQEFTRRKLALAELQYSHCGLCEHRCGVDRLAGERGLCDAGTVPRVFRAAVEYGEERELVPSQVLYLSGCDMRCEFCIAGAEGMEPQRGTELSAELFAALLADGQRRGARNLQWSGGQPGIFLPAILQLMAQAELPRPLVWKTNGRESPEAMALLEGVADVYLVDFKFGNDECARRLAGVAHYLATLQRNLRTAARTMPRVICRHLLLPGHTRCCFEPLAAWLAANLPGVDLSIRDSFFPAEGARSAELKSVVAPGEGAAAARLAARLGLKVIQ